ncbi:PhoP regulatory network protein YrbL [Shimwellia blattae]|uniref:PhoP regulatory network protein YrbL n=1 Tax=Shimwellia blattae (strain ATCC 29907 / DSM 4481 / JCM 1650 / NBRC 105725 / CDC 9005-74) TaxID=630626 RepID=I2B8Q9_SHIBC|nr:PhoP regulatory network protein YrbL [Shimwellia blattae]AFJ46913.1 hypothetical protein EBL_c18190 [Shimwellia blattae DSM 4481 = NBRC 105725]GAB82426.1 hypothetical protein YrbL [Shimwellia blattae DSM 4481 = NBRC 105725]VDY64401.1 PhoP regulatory network protein YrbL [Shimwellia blattae]VEC22515.1 PhoP regulatory network protein YrbL [Shimwellia blattae]
MQLNLSTPIGKGRHRQCYAHPANQNLCIKIVHSLAHGGDKELNRELKYYRHLQARTINWDILPRYHGQVATDQGTGYVYDLVRDYNGDVSRDLGFYLNLGQQENNFAWLTPLLAMLRLQLAQNRIVTMTLKPGNILVKRISQDQAILVIVDNIGEASLIPAASYIPYFYAKKMTRIWRRFMQLLEKYGYNAPLAITRADKKQLHSWPAQSTPALPAPAHR